MKSKRIPAAQLIRHIIQLAAIILFPGLFVTVLSSLRDIVTALIVGGFSFAAFSSQLITVLVVFLVTALWGRFFCGYVCAFGSIQELAAFISGKLAPRKKPVPEKLDRVLKYFKYAVLAFIVLGVWVLQLPVDSSLSPWGVFGLLVSGNAETAIAAIPTVGFAILLAILVGAFFVERFFCRYLCPLGAMFTLISGKRLYKIKRKGASCNGCGLCTRKCSMGIRIHDREAVDSGECVNCMKCIPACQHECLHADPSPAIAGTAASIAMCGLITVGRLTVSTQQTSVAYAAGETLSGAYQDGVYTGTGEGFRGATEVQVTVENGNITDVTVLSYQDDAEFFSRAQSSVVSAIVSGQTTEVDTVSGATYSSRGIIEAVADALGLTSASSGQGSADSTEDNGSLEDLPTDTEPSVDAESGAEDAALSDELELSSVADGVYQGAGTGFRGTTNVSVTVKNGAITDVTVTSHEDDDKYFSRAESTVISEILDAQSLDVDTVSGATFSSSSILEAVADALGVSYESSVPVGAGQHSGGFGMGGHGGGPH